MRNTGLLQNRVLAASVGVLVLAGALFLRLKQAEVDPSEEGWEGWIDRLVTFVSSPQLSSVATLSAIFDFYVERLACVRAAIRVNGHPQADAAMNRLTDRLEARKDGLAPEATEAIGDSCEQVTPAAHHDVSWHLRGRSQAGLSLWEPPRG